MSWAASGGKSSLGLRPHFSHAGSGRISTLPVQASRLARNLQPDLDGPHSWATEDAAHGRAADVDGSGRATVVPSSAVKVHDAVKSAKQKYKNLLLDSQLGSGSSAAAPTFKPAPPSPTADSDLGSGISGTPLSPLEAPQPSHRRKIRPSLFDNSSSRSTGEGHMEDGDSHLKQHMPSETTHAPNGSHPKPNTQAAASSASVATPRSGASSAAGSTRRTERAHVPPSGSKRSEQQYEEIDDAEYAATWQRKARDSKSSVLKTMANVFQSVVDGRRGNQQQEADGHKMGQRPTSPRPGSRAQRRSLASNGSKSPAAGQQTERLFARVAKVFKKAPSPEEERRNAAKAWEVCQQQQQRAAAALQRERESVEEKYMAMLFPGVHTAGQDNSLLLGARKEGREAGMPAPASPATDDIKDSRAQERRGAAGGSSISADPLMSISVSVKAPPRGPPPQHTRWSAGTSSRRVVVPLPSQQLQSQAIVTWAEALRQAKQSSGVAMTARELRRQQYRTMIMPRRALVRDADSGAGSGDEANQQIRRQQRQLSKLILLNPKVYKVNLRYGYNDRLKQMLRKKLQRRSRGDATVSDKVGAADGEFEADEAEEGSEAAEAAGLRGLYHHEVKPVAEALSELLGLQVPEKAYLGTRGATISQLSVDNVKTQCQLWLDVCGADYTKRFLAKEPSLIAKQPSVVLQSLEVFNTVLLPDAGPDQCVEFALKNTTLIGTPSEQLKASISTLASLLDIHPDAARRLALRNTTLLSRPASVLEENFEALLQLYPVSLDKLRSMLTTRSSLLTSSAARHAHVLSDLATLLGMPLFNTAVLVAASPGLLGVSMEKLQFRWKRLVELCLHTPLWESQLQSYAPPSLGRLLRVRDNSIERLSQVVDAKQTKMREALDLKKLLTMSDDNFNRIFHLALPEEHASLPLESPAVQQSAVC